MLPRPFRSEWVRELLPLEGNFQVCVRLQREVSAAGQPPPEAFSAPFQSLAIVGVWGGLAGSDFAPLDSSLALVVAAQPIGQNDVVWSFAAERIDPGLFFVIENLVHYLHVHVCRVELLRIHSTLTPSNSSVRVPLPTYHEPTSFELEYDVESSQVLVDVDFEDRVDPRELEPFRAAWNAWAEIAMQGAFADEVYPPAKASLAVEEDLSLTSTGMGGAFDEVNIADAGFYCLVNMLETFHHRHTAISTVTIE